jgi:hypothetical protein
MRQTLWTKFQQATERQEISRLNTADLERKRRACIESQEADFIRSITLPLLDKAIKESKRGMEQVK